MQRRADVAVHAEGDRDGRVAEALLDDSRVDAALQGERRPGMAEAVEREALQAVAAPRRRNISLNASGWSPLPSG